jgi:benzoate membrane transport protein
MKNVFTSSTILAGMLTVLVGFTGSLVLTFDVAEKAKLSSSELSSWVWAICVGSGILSLGLSWWYKQPVLAAWNTPGIALLAAALSKYPLSDAVGVYILSGVVIALLGALGWFEHILRLVPQHVALAVLAGALFKFGLGLFTSAALEPVLVLGMVLVFLLAKFYQSRVPMMWALLVGFSSAALLGRFDFAGVRLELAVPMLVMPTFHLEAIVGLGIPLTALALASQNAPGLAVMRSFGYTPPVKGALVSTGLLSALFGFMLSHGLTLAAITAALGNSPEAHPDPNKRYGAGMVAGIGKIVLGLFGTTIVALFFALPKALVAGMAGLALSGTIAGCLEGAFKDSKTRDSSGFALLITASGAEFLGLGSAFWGLVLGAVVAALLERQAQKAMG